MSEQENQYPIVNNYFFFKEIGSDAVGVNYRAGKINPDDRKAEKHSMVTDVYPFLFQQPNIWKRVKILLDGVKKSNIPKLYSPEDIIIENEKTMLVYPLLRGRTFEQVMEDAAKKDMPINFDLAFSITFAIADLIDIGSSIVVSGEKSFHGFLTPDNIIIDYDGKILLKNYGIYPYLSREESVFTEIEKKYGAWLAPEFLRKEKLVAQTDIYHLGYILYYILTGKYFSCAAGEDFESKFSNISFTQHIPTAEKDFLTNLITLFKKTLHPQPSQRFDNIKEFKDFVSNKFQIEELSSVTFNLAYFMNSLYLETQEEENKDLKNELNYALPEEKPEEPAVEDHKRDDHLVEDILTGLDEQKKSRTRFIVPVIVLVIIVIAVSIFVVMNQQSQVKKQQEQQRQSEQDMKRSMERFKADLESEYQRRLKEIETKATSTDEEKQQQEDEIKKLREWQKEETRKALEKQKQEDAKQKLKEQKEEDVRKEKEAEAARIKQEQEDEARKLQEAQKQKEQEVQRKKLEEAQKITEGQLLALTEATEKPVKLKGKNPSFSFILKKKYKGTELNVRTILLIDEKGAVTDVRMLAKTPGDLENVIVKSFKRWQYKPATKDGVKVKVWLPVAIRITF